MIHARKDYQRIQDPIGKIAADEPVFLLRAQDQTAADVVRFYGKNLISQGGDVAIAALAFSHALEMDRWREAHGDGKLPDLPDGFFEEEEDHSP